MNTNKFWGPVILLVLVLVHRFRLFEYENEDEEEDDRSNVKPVIANRFRHQRRHEMINRQARLYPRADF